MLTLNHVIISLSRGNHRRLGSHYVKPVGQACRATSSASTKLPSPRVINVSDEVLDRDTLELLGKGPNFALSRAINASTLNMVEMGVQRAIYGLKWIEHINEKKAMGRESSQNSSEHQTDVSLTGDQSATHAPLARPYFPDSYACQVPAS